MKLTPVQQAVFEMMEDGRWYSASELGCRFSTLEAIYKKGSLRRSDLAARKKLGSMFIPGVGVLFRRETEGRGR